VADGLPGSLLYRSFQDSHGFIWFGSDAGVARFDGTRFDLFTMDDGLSDNEIFGIHEDKEGNIWFRTDLFPRT
jgi:ligand-binding sensor domain-containing protein